MSAARYSAMAARRRQIRAAVNARLIIVGESRLSATEGGAIWAGGEQSHDGQRSGSTFRSKVRNDDRVLVTHRSPVTYARLGYGVII